MRIGSALGLVFVLLFTGVGLFPSTSVEAAAPRLFEVSNVTVDVTSDSAATARVQAMAEGEKKAFILLLKRLTLQAYHNRLPDIGAAQITELVQDFTVAEEKASTVRYIAKLNYRFRAKGVRALLDEYGLPFAETSSKPVLM
ncbi:MAG: DUF2066 domain-containing protein [Magnetovibrio sp.]|nr:DUF2066 domain-containing protein [Magnetovibrio sp.]